ncbi:MAG: transporter related [Bacteroidetes bacterium]|nr:transporter related [Bacteroidota bacterium]
MSTNGRILSVNNLSVSFVRWGQEVQALQSVSFEVTKGEWLILVGPNGSGKSTLLNVLSARLDPNQGEIQLNGRTIGDMSAQDMAENAFYVHQNPLLSAAPTLTLYENLLVSDIHSHHRSEKKAQLLEKYTALLEPLGLSGRMKQPAKTLSGGERMLLGLTIARLRPGSLILLDEPFASLDPGKLELCLKSISDLNALGKTIIQVSHDPEVATTLGTRTLVLNQGQLSLDVSGTKRSTIDIQAHWYTTTEKSSVHV